MTIPSIEQVESLNGKIVAMLSEDEQAVLDFYRLQGRKYGVTISVVNEANPEGLARATSREQADQLLKRSSSRVSVIVSQ
ncbi:hypothetical protein LA345_36575 (plasmid) [Burkholderia vietnamiensis]|uniref:Uncharacterized protein n=1 Tax=Burkholderia vietnamiensis (strain G4 / LMG 22486) TaxID=269482 RepID=A4JVT8_BURVG|nr:hypothetical protein Bcep1808_7516 [Burkholderia vietnamiensis G4]MCB4349328.1 hypothetical protein [Burkholderia vietnamiensis]